jgi:hypothetical protein
MPCGVTNAKNIILMNVVIIILPIIEGMMIGAMIIRTNQMTIKELNLVNLTAPIQILE